jgi:hypothetical protein
MVSDAEQLASWRTIGARYSEQVLELAPKVLKSGGLGEQGKFSNSLQVVRAEDQNGEYENSWRSLHWIWGVYQSPRYANASKWCAELIE